MARIELPVHKASTDGWTDWRWQQRNALRTVDDLVAAFPALPGGLLDTITHALAERRIQITPYALGLIKRTPDGRSPELDDPMWRQLVPYWTTEGNTAYSYDGESENWEMPEEMVTPIAQRKYDNRVIIRLANVCQSYCQFCYEALRTIEKDSDKGGFDQKLWNDTLAFIRREQAIEEVILSGGEPLMHSDERLERVLADLRELPRRIAIRVHTRSCTYNPFRLTDALLASFERHEVNAVGLHVCHPNEITPEFRAAVKRLSKAVPILFANIPLLGGINDTPAVMHELGMALYQLGVVPHYLYHFLPFSPGSQVFRTTVRRGVDIIRALKRRITDLAVPEFVVPHASGKHTMPLLGESEAAPEWVTDGEGRRFVRYTNWQGKIVEYPDV